MKIEPSGVILTDTCSVQTEKCVAKQPGPITAVWTLPGRLQVNVCRPCLEEKVRSGEWEIPGAKITTRFDVAAYGSDRKPVLVVEVKKRSATISPRQGGWQIYRNLVTHAGLPYAQYFLLALLPDYFYLWKHTTGEASTREPDYEIQARELLAPYFERLAIDPTVATGFDLERVIALWLKDMANGENLPSAGEQWFYDSGLAQALSHSLVEVQSAIAA